MAESIADIMQRFTEQVARSECVLIEPIIAAYVEETGRFPRLAHDDQRWWCVGPAPQMPSADDAAWAAKVAGVFLAETSIPASKARLVREFEGTTFSWRWEERK